MMLLSSNVAFADDASAGNADEAGGGGDESMVRVPLDLLVHGSGVLADTTFALVGCTSVDELHEVALTGPSQLVHCKSKGVVSVYAVSTKEAASLRALLTKDSGTASPTEAGETKKLIGKGMLCGKIDEQTLVEKAKNITLLTAHFMATKTKEDCSLKKVGTTIPQTPELRHPPPKPSVAPTPSAADSAQPVAGPAKSGCSCGGCVTARTRQTGDLELGILSGVTCALALARRRSRSLARRR
jgi:hypothetical protein